MPLFPAEFETHTAVIYALDSDLRLRYCNRAWDSFALENGGGAELLRVFQIGKPVLRAIPAPLQDFYRSLYERAFGSEQPLDHFYECSSPGEIRWFHLHLTRIDPEGEEPCVVAINSVVAQGPMSRQERQYSADRFRNEFGLITMCAHCRRTLEAGTKDTWLWAPDLVRRMPMDVSHGLCPVCFAMYYGRVAAK